MGKLRRAWREGMSEGLVGSGFIYGVLLPLLALVLMIALGYGLYRYAFYTPDPPQRCIDYSFDVGYIDKRSMTCTRWPAMKMSVDERLIKADVVHCRCTEASFPQPEEH